jgi:hypothetical protein
MNIQSQVWLTLTSHTWGLDMQFEQIASAQFQIGTGSETITIEGVPYIWDSTRSGRDEQASLAVATYIGDFNLSKGKPVTLLWVSSKPHNREG